MRLSTVITLFALVIIVAGTGAMKLSSHPVAWIVGLICAIPIFAAVAGNAFSVKQ